MARKTLVVLTDDLDGSTADQTVTFALDGRSYEIDLSDQNASILRDALRPYTDAARRVGGTANRTTRTANSRPRIRD